MALSDIGVILMAMEGRYAGNAGAISGGMAMEGRYAGNAGAISGIMAGVPKTQEQFPLLVANYRRSSRHFLTRTANSV
jgi:hypothetical protein